MPSAEKDVRSDATIEDYARATAAAFGLDPDEAARQLPSAEAAPACEHYWAWVSPAGTSRSARICQFCHQPDAKWLSHTVEVDLGHGAGCLDCEFAETRILPPGGVPCTCGAQRVTPYPNDTGYHSTTECIDETTGHVIPPGTGDPQ